jgi:hypothetical protein
VTELDHMIAFVDGAEVRVNFGVFAGRSATPAEVDGLARALLAEVAEVTIVAEDRYELSRHSEGMVHQVRIELPEGADPQHIADIAERWAQQCIAARHAEI